MMDWQTDRQTSTAWITASYYSYCFHIKTSGIK